jgi:hypothetical protein
MSFLQDRVHGQYAIPRLAIIIRERALAAATAPPPKFLPLSLSNLNEVMLQFGRQQLTG